MIGVVTTMCGLSGADGMVYMEYRCGNAGFGSGFVFGFL